ncbi:MAG TPA: YfhO family protein [Vicinamibacteria bacterium]|nr:YfhO family protein [Vicinamibacteria bacterium]
MSRAEGRWLPALAALVSLLPNLEAAWPDRTYFFRDFTLTYYPLREVMVGALREGRWPFWNPFLHEGCAFLPMLYPLELVQVLRPGPVFASWLLTMHFPIAALGGFWLARELGISRLGAFATASVWSSCGLATTSLDLHWFLQAYALAPLVAVTLCRAARAGGLAIGLAAATLAVAISTLAVEFVAQAALCGTALALTAPRDAAAGLRVGRLCWALLVGASLAALPMALVLGLLGGSVRGAGLEAGLALEKSLHPLSLLQLAIPDLHGSVREPLREWWAGRLLPGGSPYFLSLYLGPVALALAAAGAAAPSRRTRFVLLGLGAAGLLCALGPWGGVAGLLAEGLPFLRFPVKAMLTPTLVVALLAGFGVDRLLRGLGQAAALGGAASIAMAAVLAATATLAPGLVRWLEISPRAAAMMRATLARESAECVGFAAALAGTLWLTRPGRLAALRSPSILALLCLDLWHAAVGVNKQVEARVFQPAPGLREALADLDGGRLFSLGVDRSPTVETLVARREPGIEARSFALARQVLNPYTSLLDRVETAEDVDRLSFIPNPPLVPLEERVPQAVAGILPRLRNAAVDRILSLDPLDHPDLVLREEFATGVAETRVRMYALARPWPRAFVACRVVSAADRRSATLFPFTAGYDPGRDVALEGAGAAGCAHGRVLGRRTRDFERQEVEVAAEGGAGYLVVRDSHAPGWRAFVDGSAAPLLRANGRHRAVPVPAGRHVVRFEYHPPGLRLGAAVSTLGLVLLGLTCVRPR